MYAREGEPGDEAKVLIQYMYRYMYMPYYISLQNDKMWSCQVSRKRPEPTHHSSDVCLVLQ